VLTNQGLQFDRIKSITGGDAAQPTRKQNLDTKGPSFGDVLKGTQTSNITPKEGLEKAATALKFSNHAIDRIRSRGITLGPEKLQKMEQAIDKAAQKGAKETLVMSGDSAFIVSVKNRTVITAVDTNAMKENVFTNIDSTVLI
jgi:flagellar operon protein